MINGDITSFINKLTLGEDLTIIFDGKEFFIQGYFQDAKHYLECFEHGQSSKGYCWRMCDPSRGVLTQLFLEAPIWNGKTFLEAEQEITWEY